jgi:DNA-binding NtrC family response regulator
MGEGLRILVVDDNALVAEATAGALAVAGHQAEWALSAEDAVALHRPGTWDIVLTDLRLPGMDGWDLITVLRQREPALAVGVITGALSGDAAPRSPESEAPLFVLLKPVDPEALLRQLEHVRSPRQVGR